MFKYIIQDWEANAGSVKGRFITLAFRAGQLARQSPSVVRWFFIPYVMFYIVIIDWCLCVELPLGVCIGPGLKILHGHGLVVNVNAIIGRNCHLRQCTTIGNTQRQPDIAPHIGDNVNIGSNSVLIGPITIGSNAVVGAGSVVIKDVAEGTTVVGNPAHVVIQKVRPHASSSRQPESVVISLQ
jgi:putative colanic acid biosynthesis acetyltransferase WcaB